MVEIILFYMRLLRPFEARNDIGLVIASGE